MKRLLVLVALAAACSARRPPPPAQTIEVLVRGERLQVELAAEPVARELGLGFRRDIPDDGGMLFAFAQPEPLVFTARDNFLPLSMAFLDGDGEILNIEDMEALDGATLHRSAGAAGFALAVRQGWFAAHGVQVGDGCAFDLPERVIVR